jgi:hypothetical protein
MGRLRGCWLLVTCCPRASSDIYVRVNFVTTHASEYLIDSDAVCRCDLQLVAAPEPLGSEVALVR